MNRFIASLTLGATILVALASPGHADEDVQVLVINNVPEASSLPLFAIGLAAVAAVGLYRRVQRRKDRTDDAD